MTPSEYDQSLIGRSHAALIRERYARAIVVHDVHGGRDRHGFRPEQRTRFEAWRKCGNDPFAAAVYLLDEADRTVGG